MTAILFDSDVLLDFFFDRKSYSESTATVLSLCELRKLSGYTTAVILSNMYYLLRKQSSHQFVLKKLRQLLSIIDIIAIEKAAVLQALDSSFTDFEDALQNYSAEESKKIDIILTRNNKDYKHSNLIIMTPRDFMATL